MKAGAITRERLDDALAEQRRRGALPGRLVVILIERGDVTEGAVVRAVAQELCLPWVSMRHVDVSDTLTRLIPRRTAEEFCVMPVYVRRELKGPLTLYLAMDDPTWEEALYTSSVIAGMPVRPMVAAHSEVVAAIAEHYPKPPVVISAPRPSPGPSRTRPPAGR